MRDAPLRGLWLARELPFPLDGGDGTYSAHLAKSLAEAGADLTFAGLVPESRPEIPEDWPIRWHPVAGRCNAGWRSLLGPMPLAAAAHATGRYRREVATLARDGWDFVVFDQYGTGWALEPFLARREGRRPVLVHVAHRHEASAGGALCRELPLLRRLAFWQDSLKTRTFERSLVARVDLATAATDGDAALFEADAPEVPILVLRPGYHGAVSSRSVITAATPRRVVMAGPFHDAAKRETLRRFIAVADPTFGGRGVELHVAGFVPPEFMAELAGSCRAVRWHGTVDDIAPLLESARIAVMPETDGGFKLRFLDYIFGRVPVATLGEAAAGLPEEIRAAMLCRDGLERLVAGIGGLMDDLELLNRMQQRALAAAEPLFRWRDRGTALLSAIRATREFGRRPHPGSCSVPGEFTGLQGHGHDPVVRHQAPEDKPRVLSAGDSSMEFSRPHGPSRLPALR